MESGQLSAKAATVSKVNKTSKINKLPKKLPMVKRKKKGDDVRDNPQGSQATEVTFNENHEVCHMQVDAEEDAILFGDHAETDLNTSIDNANTNATTSMVIKPKSHKIAKKSKSIINNTDTEVRKNNRGSLVITEDNQGIDIEFLNPQSDNEDADSVPEENSQTAYHAENEYGIDDNIHQRIIGETVAKTIKQLMMDGRLVMEKELDSAKLKNKFKQRNTTQESKGNAIQASSSDLTIYDHAVVEQLEENVNDKIPNRISSSSEDAGDTSDETIMLQPTDDLAAVNAQQFMNRNNEIIESIVDDYRRLAVADVQPGPSRFTALLTATS